MVSEAYRNVERWSVPGLATELQEISEQTNPLERDPLVIGDGHRDCLEVVRELAGRQVVGFAVARSADFSSGGGGGSGRLSMRATVHEPIGTTSARLFGPNHRLGDRGGDRRKSFCGCAQGCNVSRMGVTLRPLNFAVAVEGPRLLGSG